MKNFIFFLLFVASGLAAAAQLEDVQILDVKSSADSTELKLRWRGPSRESTFFVNVLKSDPNSFEKMSYVSKKLMYQSNYKLNLNIPNFSPAPDGSYYTSNDIDFSGGSSRDPNSVAKKKASKKH